MAEGKVLTTIIDIAGQVDKSLGSSINTAMRLLKGLDKSAIAEVASIGLGLGAAVEAGKLFYQFMDDSIQKASEWEEEMAGVVKVTDGMRDSFGNYTDLYYGASQDLMDIAARLPVDMMELPETMAATLQDGTIAIDEAAKAVEHAAMAGMALDIPLEDAAKVLSTLRVDLHMTEDDAYGVAQAFNYLGERSARTPAELADVASGLAGISEIAGMSTSQIIAMATAIPSLEPSKVATSMKNFISALEKGEFATGQPRKAMNILGIDPKQFAVQMQEDAVEGLNIFYEKFGALDKTKRLAVLDMFGGRRGMESIAKLLTNYDIYQSSLADLNAGLQQNSIEREVESRRNTSKGAKKMFQNDLEAFQIDIGYNFLPIKQGMYNALHEAFDEAKPELQTLGESMGNLLQSGGAKSSIKQWLGDYVTQVEHGAEILTWVNDDIAIAIDKVAEWRKEFSFLDGAFLGFKQTALNTLNPLRSITENIYILFKGLRSGASQFGQTMLGFEDSINSKLKVMANWLDNVFGKLQKFAGAGKLLGAVTSGVSAASSAVSKAALAASGMKGTKTRQYAAGGFASTASIFGEAGLEAAISFDPKYRERNIGIWTEAGRMLGTLSDNPLSSGGDGISVSVGNVTYEVVVHEGTRENVVKALRDSEPEFADMLIDTLIRYKRGAYCGGSI